MDKNKVIELLTDYNSYEFAAKNAQHKSGGIPMPATILDLNVEGRKPKILGINSWDDRRYNRIVALTKKALDEVLSDDQRSVIMKKYLDRNTMSLNQIANYMGRDRGTISKWHTQALNKLTKALAPLDVEFMEIENVDFMFKPA
ncbi:sigma factor-like helix-turn-helix DNA-binding protein [Paenibacillus peoriae]|uniref:sigma factor-like helix-turn-helix DNA-binding protein n=1 Tax=Paenibacillus peoriae TaxID=59893 RepID=UPI0009701A10|nr:sigma factor-like helix-turn-helix DNA-binding protein [Paenibacillus peoriae]OMF48605.1 hypothetical protein BK135_09930 [Paenibacillus peoriae]